jgi:AAA ATPase domain
MATNPFRPSFGTSPPLLVGRDTEVAEFAIGLDEGPGSPMRATIYTGARGVGKTVMLNRAEDAARERGWLVISETANAGIIERITAEHLPALRELAVGNAQTKRITGASAPFGLGSVSWETVGDEQGRVGLRTRISELCLHLAQNGTGLLITVDEIHGAPIDEIRTLTTTIQHSFREDLEIAFVAAGLPSAVDAILNDAVLTFLRRADRRVLATVHIDDVKLALRIPIEDAGRTIGEAELATAANATRGYPFMVQLVGYNIWNQNPNTQSITMDDVDQGAAIALRRVGQLVVEPSLQDLSATDRTFLLAMATDDGPSSMKAIAQRLNVDANYASQYRLRLLAAEVIVSTGHGMVDFALPSMRDYLKEHAALEAQRSFAVPIDPPN